MWSKPIMNLHDVCECSDNKISKIYKTCYLLGYTEYLHPGAAFEGTESNIGVIAIGFYNGMWAYDGW